MKTHAGRQHESRKPIDPRTRTFLWGADSVEPYARFMVEFVRYQSAVPNRNGHYPGVFALANGLRHNGLLTAEDARWHREANRRATAAYVDPATIDPDCYDQTRNRGARAWFVAEAVELLTMTVPYLDLLDRYGVPWMQLTTRVPGRIVYRDVNQVVAVPHSYPDDWHFPASR